MVTVSSPELRFNASFQLREIFKIISHIHKSLHCSNNIPHVCLTYINLHVHLVNSKNQVKL